MDEPHPSLTVDKTWYAEAVHLRVPDDGTGYVVSIPVHGAFEAVHRGHAVDADPARAAVFQPDGDVDLRCGADCSCYVVWIDMSVLADVLEHYLGHAVHRPLTLATTLDLDTAAGRTWTALIRLLDTVPVLHHPLLAEPVQETVAARLLLAVDHPYHEELDAPTHSWGPGPVKRLVDAVEAFPRYPVHRHRTRRPQRGQRARPARVLPTSPRGLAHRATPQRPAGSGTPRTRRR